MIEDLQLKSWLCQNKSTLSSNLRSLHRSKNWTGQSPFLSTTSPGMKSSSTSSLQKSASKSTLALLETQWLSTTKSWEGKTSTKSILQGSWMRHRESFSVQLPRRAAWAKQLLHSLLTKTEQLRRRLTRAKTSKGSASAEVSLTLSLATSSCVRTKMPVLMGAGSTLSALETSLRWLRRTSWSLTSGIVRTAKENRKTTKKAPKTILTPKSRRLHRRVFSSSLLSRFCLSSLKKLMKRALLSRILSQWKMQQRNCKQSNPSETKLSHCLSPCLDPNPLLTTCL